MPKTKTKSPADAVEAPLRTTKIDALVALLRTEAGADVAALMAVTGWQAHSVRGAIAGHIKRKLSLIVATERVDGRTVYRIV